MKNGEEKWLLIHIEVQGYEDECPNYDIRDPRTDHCKSFEDVCDGAEERARGFILEAAQWSKQQTWFPCVLHPTLVDKTAS